MTYSGVIQGALEAVQNPPDPTDHRSSWEPFKQVNIEGFLLLDVDSDFNQNSF